MKILLVNDYGVRYGGAELMLLALRDGLRRGGHDARLLASDYPLGGENSVADYEFPAIRPRWRALLRAANPQAYWRLRQVLAEFQPDIVHLGLFMTQLSPLVLPLLRNVPSLYHAHWYESICPIWTKLLPDGNICRAPAGAVCYQKRCLPRGGWLLAMLRMRLWNRWRGAFKIIVTCSEAVRGRLIAEGIAPVEVIRNGVPLRPARPPLADPPTVAFAGRLVKEKGVELLARAFARAAKEIPRARLLLAGNGPEEERLKKLTGDLGLSGSLRFLGHVPRDKMEDEFNAAWAQAVPSHWEEPFPAAALEAMMRGTAVVASRIGGLGEIVRENQTGLLVAPGDEQALAAALIRLLRDKELAEAMGRAGREVALADFSEENYVACFIRLYEDLRHNG
jgi:glycosyltransferase involved in cell wall biosynthesis